MKYLVLFGVLIQLLWQSNAAAATMQVELERGGVSQIVSTQTFLVRKDRYQVLEMSLPVPEGSTVKLNPLESSSNENFNEDGAVDLPVRTGSQGKFVLVARAEGMLELTSPDGKKELIKFRIKNINRVFEVSKSCDKFKFRAKILVLGSSFIPGTLICETLDKQKISRIYFVSFEDSFWKNENVFEIAGKGEVWKEFSTEEFLLKDTVSFEFGNEESPTKVQIEIPKLKIATPSEEKPYSLKFGLSYSIGNLKKVSTTTGEFKQNLNGVNLEGYGEYFQKNTSLVYKGHIETLIQSKEEGTSNAGGITSYGGIAAYRFKPGSRHLDLGVVVDLHSYSLPKLGLNTQLTSPGIHLAYSEYFGSKKMEFVVASSSSNQGGTGKNTSIDLNFGDFKLWNVPLQIGLGQRAVDVKTTTVTFKGQWSLVRLLFSY